MPKIIVLDTILNSINYRNVTDDDNIRFIIRSPHIGYYTVHFDYKPYYYIIWRDSRITNYKLSSFFKYYLSILDDIYCSNSGIYLIIKYDKITHTVLDINDTLDNIKNDIQ